MDDKEDMVRHIVIKEEGCFDNTKAYNLQRKGKEYSAATSIQVQE